MHYALALRDRLDLTEADAPCVAHLTTLAADLGHTSWLLALATAGRTHVVGEEHARDAPACWAALRDAGCSVVKTTPSHMAELWRDRPDPRREAIPYRPGTLILGGEALPRSLGASLLHDEGAHRLLNHYDPTETTAGAACLLATSAGELPEDETTVPIGTPLGEATLDLLDSSGFPVAEGEPGHLHIGGDAAVSSTALHWLAPDELTVLYRTLAGRLRPGGVFVDADNRRPADSQDLNDIAHHVRTRRAHRTGRQGREAWAGWWKTFLSAPELAPLAEARARSPIAHRTFREPNGLTTADQITLLREAGFSGAATVWQCGNDSVLVAVR